MITKSKKGYFVIKYEYEGKTRKIINKSWTWNVGIRYMRKIEQEEIQKDIAIYEDKKKLDIKSYKHTLTEQVFIYLDYIEGQRSITTLRDLNSFFRKYIIPFFEIDNTKNYPISEAITVDKIMEFRSYLNNLKLCAGRKNHMLAMLKSFLDYEVINDELEGNVVTKCKLLMTQYSSKNEEEHTAKLNFWTNEEYDQFIATFDNEDPFKLLFEVCYWGALRIGELTALKFKDFNFKQHTLSISRSADQKRNVTKPKTASSNATIHLRSEICNKVQQFMIAVQAEDDDWVFFADRIVDRATINLKMNQHIKQANVKKISMHGLRHSMASRMINAGANVLTVSKHLRHSSPDQTLHTYSHLFPMTDENLIEKI